MRAVRARRESTIEDVNKAAQMDDYARQMTRRWNVGEVYAPHDLSPSEMAKWRRNQARKKDLVDMLGLRPLDMYRVSGCDFIDVAAAAAWTPFFPLKYRSSGNRETDKDV